MATEILDDDISTLSSEEDSGDNESHVSSNSGESYISKITKNPQFYVLAQFLESPNTNKNITVIMEELVNELRLIRESIVKKP
jgi:hypothetical protein